MVGSNLPQLLQDFDTEVPHFSQLNVLLGRGVIIDHTVSAISVATGNKTKLS